MYDIITFGSASQDIYVKSKKFFTAGNGICVPPGLKTEVDDLAIFSGGGGTNAAATFANQGFKVAYCGMVGQDPFGRLAVEELKKLKISCDLLKTTGKKSTNISFFLTYPGKDRTILVYRGASDELSRKDIPWAKIKKAKWFYLAPFGGRLASLTGILIDFAKKNGIKIALNPGYNQLTLPVKTLKEILQKIDILILNREEASLLTGIPPQKEKEIFKKIDGLVRGISIMTKGGDGVIVSDGQNLFSAKSLASSLGWKTVDATGAGDAFGSGFVSGFLKSKGDIEYSIQLAMANATFNMLKWGAKDGLLKKNQKWPKIGVLKEACGKEGLCQTKS
ncbi:MAG: carbohydrate kinase family protein [Candidatus Nealsonbacteria bacterium]|nr:carbohydrate kinase family protein [Candidatus Nealsonbacteria bacterium]